MLVSCCKISGLQDLDGAQNPWLINKSSWGEACGSWTWRACLTVVRCIRRPMKTKGSAAGGSTSVVFKLTGKAEQPYSPNNPEATSHFLITVTTSLGYLCDLCSSQFFALCTVPGLNDIFWIYLHKILSRMVLFHPYNIGIKQKGQVPPSHRKGTWNPGHCHCCRRSLGTDHGSRFGFKHWRWISLLNSHRISIRSVWILSPFHRWEQQRRREIK